MINASAVVMDEATNKERVGDKRKPTLTHRFGAKNNLTGKSFKDFNK